MTELGRSFQNLGVVGKKGGGQAEGCVASAAKQRTSDHKVSALTCSPRFSIECMPLTTGTCKCPLIPRRVSLFHKRNEWPERVARLLHEGGQRQVGVASSHEIFISMLPASQRNFWIYYHAGTVVQLTLTKNTCALYELSFWADQCFHHNIYFWVNRLNSLILIQNRKIREWK